MPTKKPQEPSSDTSEESIPERPFFKLATRVKVTSTEPYTDAYSFDLGIRYVEDHGNIVVSHRIYRGQFLYGTTFSQRGPHRLIRKKHPRTPR